MLLKFGLSRQSAELFRGLTGRNSRDPAAWEGLGEAEFAGDDYPAARDAFRNALEIDPTDETAARRIEVCDRILALDPTLKGLTAQARFARSREILEGVLNAWMGCTLPGVAAANVVSAREELASKGRPRSWSNAAESNLDLAKRIWTVHQGSCSQGAAPDDPLSRVMSRLMRG